MTPEMKDYIKGQCGRSIKDRGYIFVKDIDSHCISILKERHPDLCVIGESLVSFDNCVWVMRQLRRSDKWVKPKRLIIDERIDDEVLEESFLIHNINFCESVEFIPEVDYEICRNNL